MAQRTTLQQAARNALASWLEGELEGEEIVIEPRWISADRQLPPKAITIIDAGPRQIEWLQSEVLAVAAVAGDDTKLDVIWNFGFVEQPIQLDVWAPSDVELDDIVARLDASLNKGVNGLGVVNADSFRAGLQLALADGWEPGIASFEFESVDIDQTPSSVGESEWRATYRGVVNAQMVQIARTAKLARVLLKTRLNDVDPQDVLTINLPTDP